jgi:kumamolisin
MSTSESRIPLRGSERQPLPGARAVGPVDPGEQVRVSIFLRRSPASSGLNSNGSSRRVAERQYLSREEYAATHGAAAEDIVRVEAFALSHKLSVEERSQARRTVVLGGTVSAMSAAFGVELQRFEYAGGVYRGRVGPLHVPPDLVDIVEGVFGLDDRPQAEPHFRAAASDARASGAVATRVVANAFAPPQVATAYNFPPNLNGQGECIAIIELGGGYRPNELQTYFGQLGVTPPKVDAVSVDGGANRPEGNPTGPDGEVLLDIEVAGSVAPGAHIVVYFAPNTDQGFLDALTTAIHDDQNKPSLVSISWGAAEPLWTAQALNAFDQACQAGAALGVTILCASGDNGSADRTTDGRAHVDFPASSPNVLACGGTNLQASDGTIAEEVVWNDGGGGSSGGGVSESFGLPTWQGSANVPPSANPGGAVGRGVPDVAGDADPATGYNILVDGQSLVFGGTSAVAPLWAGLLALINQGLGKPVGFLNPVLYSQLAGTKALHDITSGNNVVGNAPGYQAGPGWDACTGLGSPNGVQLLKELGGQVSEQTYPVVGVQFTGTVAAGSTARWYTYDWPANWYVVWTVVPTTFSQSAAQIGWTVQVQRVSATSITYWIIITNSTNVPVEIEARYAVVGASPSSSLSAPTRTDATDGGPAPPGLSG